MTRVTSRRRVVDHGEVFTLAWMVETMLDLVKGESEHIDVRFRRTPKRKSPKRVRAFEYGGQGRNRTTDTRIFSPLLYQLSYLAPGRRPVARRALSGRVRVRAGDSRREARNLNRRADTAGRDRVSNLPGSSSRDLRSHRAGCL